MTIEPREVICEEVGKRKGQRPCSCDGRERLHRKKTHGSSVAALVSGNVGVSRRGSSSVDLRATSDLGESGKDGQSGDCGEDDEGDGGADESGSERGDELVVRR